MKLMKKLLFLKTNKLVKLKRVQKTKRDFSKNFEMNKNFFKYCNVFILILKTLHFLLGTLGLVKFMIPERRSCQ